MVTLVLLSTKLVFYFAFSAFVNSVNVSAQEIGMGKRVKHWVTWSSIKQFVLYFFLTFVSLLEDVHKSCGKSASHTQELVTLFLVSGVCLCEYAHLPVQVCVCVFVRVFVPFHVCSFVYMGVRVCVLKSPQNYLLPCIQHTSLHKR